MADNPAAFASIKLEGVDVAATVQSAIIEDNDRLIDKAEIVLEDPHQAASDLPREQQRITVDLGWQQEHAVLFEGVVTGVEITGKGGASQRVKITAYDLSYKLMQGDPPPPVNHVGKLSDIVKTVFNRRPSGASIGEIAPDPDPQFDEDHPLRQANLRDWEFIQQLAVQYNCRAFVEYNDKASKFYFIPVQRLVKGDPMGKLHYCRGFSELIEFSFQRVASAAAPSVSATAVDPSTGKAATSAGAPPSPSDPPDSSSTTRSRLKGVGSGLADDYDASIQAASSAPGKPSDQLPQTSTAGTPSDPALAQTQIRQDPTRILGYVGQGEAVGTIMLRAKGKVTIEGLSAWAEGDWYVTKAVHEFTRSTADRKTRSTYRTKFSVTR